MSHLKSRWGTDSGDEPMVARLSGGVGHIGIPDGEGVRQERELVPEDRAGRAVQVHTYSGLQEFEQGDEDPFGEPPDHMWAQMVGRESAGLAAEQELYLTIVGGIAERGEGNPEGLRHL